MILYINIFANHVFFLFDLPYRVKVKTETS